MRILNLEEIQYVYGAKFCDDVSALAGAIVIVQYVYFAGAYATSYLGDMLYGAMVGSHHQSTIKKATQVLTPLGGIAAPVFVANRIFSRHPEYQKELMEKIEMYF